MIVETALAVEEVAGLAALEALRDEWSALCDRRPETTPFQRPEWLLPWSHSFPPHEPWLLTIRTEERQLAGLFPLFLWRNGVERTVALFGAGHSDYLDAIVDPAIEIAVIGALLSWLEFRHGAWDVCDFEQLRPSSPLLRVPPPAGWRDQVVPSIPCQLLDLPDRFERFRGRISDRLFQRIPYYVRRLEKLGRLELRSAGAADRDDGLAHLFELHTARWRQRGESGVFGEPRVQAFHREAAAGFSSRGDLVLYTLHLEDQALAAVYGFREREGTYFYAQAFDPDHAKLSPGVVVLALAVEEEIRRGARFCDYLRGREAYKEQWRTREALTFRRRLSHRA